MTNKEHYGEESTVAWIKECDGRKKMDCARCSWFTAGVRNGIACFQAWENSECKPPKPRGKRT